MTFVCGSQWCTRQKNSLSPLQMTYQKTGLNICWQMSLFGVHVFVFCAADKEANIHRASVTTVIGPKSRRFTTVEQDGEATSALHYPRRTLLYVLHVFNAPVQLNQGGRAANEFLLIKATAVKMPIYYTPQKACCHVLYLLNVENILP